jgi:hypothetical protein
LVVMALPLLLLLVMLMLMALPMACGDVWWQARSAGVIRLSSNAMR